MTQEPIEREIDLTPIFNKASAMYKKAGAMYKNVDAIDKFGFWAGLAGIATCNLAGIILGSPLLALSVIDAVRDACKGPPGTKSPKASNKPRP
jgi:hypothetical protein